MNETKKPTMAGADPAVLARQAQQEDTAKKQMLAQKKNMMLGVAINAPISLDDAFTVAVADDEGFAKAITVLAEEDDMELDPDVVSALAEPTLRVHVLRVHAAMSVEWAQALTDHVSITVEEAERDAAMIRDLDKAAAGGTA